MPFAATVVKDAPAVISPVINPSHAPSIAPLTAPIAALVAAIFRDAIKTGAAVPLVAAVAITPIAIAEELSLCSQQLGGCQPVFPVP